MRNGWLPLHEHLQQQGRRHQQQASLQQQKFDGAPSFAAHVPQRRRTDPGYTVEESGADHPAAAIVDCRIETRTVWRCPGCNTLWAKPGAHGGKLKQCRSCGLKFFLRRSET